MNGWSSFEFHFCFKFDSFYYYSCCCCCCCSSFFHFEFSYEMLTMRWWFCVFHLFVCRFLFLFHFQNLIWINDVAFSADSCIWLNWWVSMYMWPQWRHISAVLVTNFAVKSMEIYTQCHLRLNSRNQISTLINSLK